MHTRYHARSHGVRGPVADHARLAAAGPSHDGNGPRDGGHGLALRVVEVLEEDLGIKHVSSLADPTSLGLQPAMSALPIASQTYDAIMANEQMDDADRKAFLDRFEATGSTKSLRALAKEAKSFEPASDPA